MSEFDNAPEEPVAAPEPQEAPEVVAEAAPEADFQAPPPPQYQAPPQADFQAPPPQYQAPPPPQYGQPQYAAELPLHVPSLIIGILALVFAIFTGFVGLILGIVGVVIAKKNKHAYKTSVGFGLSLAGLIIGAIVTVILIVVKVPPHVFSSHLLNPAVK